MSIADTLSAVILIVAIVIISLMAYFIYQYYQTLPSNNTAYCADCQPLGSPTGPGCHEGYDYYGGVCYVDRWTKFGGTKTAVCSVEYPGECSGAGYGCYVDITQELPPGTECTADNIPGWSSGEGYFVVNGITTNYCAKGGTHEIWCDRGTQGGAADVCPNGGDYFEGWCCPNKCPAGQTRTEYCICQAS